MVMASFYTNVYQRGNTIYVRGYGNGKPFKDEIEYRPYLFVLGEGEDYRTVDGSPVVKKTFDSMRAGTDFIKSYEDVSNYEIFGLSYWQYVFMNDEFPGHVDYDASLISVVSIDIEVASPEGMPDINLADQPVTAITMVKGDKVLTLGTKAYTPHEPGVGYVLCVDEKQLLFDFLLFWNDPEWAPDVVTGWSSDMFDIPYLINRVKRVLGESFVKQFSPWGFVHEREVIRAKGSYANFNDRKEIVYDIAGITQLDYLQLYKKFTFTNHESYALGSIAHVELGEGKVDYSEYRSLNELYDKNFAKFIDYNIRDARLVSRLDDKLGFIPLVFALAYKAKVNYTDAMTTIRPWDIIIHNHLMDKKIVIPQYTAKVTREFQGAYVKDVQIGLHQWVVSFDLTSLYPSLISQVNVSPETFVEMIPMPSMEHMLENRGGEDWGYGPEYSLGVNGGVYRKDKQGFLGELVDLFISDRAKIKKQQLALENKHDPALDNEITKLFNYQWALKILTNGLYGALGNQYFRWFDVNLAESITITGQLAVRWIMESMNVYLNKTLNTKDKDYIVAGDTDSIYINLGPLVEECGMSGQSPESIVAFLDKVCKEKLEPFIQRHFVELGNVLNSYSHKLFMKREAICSKAIFRGKKMYILNVWNSEGVQYTTPKLKVKGIEAVRSSTPLACRNAIRQALSIIMNKEESDLHTFLAEFEKEFRAMPFVDIAFPRSINNLEDYYDETTIFKKKCPIHVRGALLYNKRLDELGLLHKYARIRNKDKIKFIYLKTPNSIGQNVIAASSELPEEFDLDRYIDLDTQLEKAFLSPIKSITSVIGWTTEPISTVMRLFG